MTMLQPSKGTYALLLALGEETLFPLVGPFGAVRLPAGHYIYLGSAFGAGGVKGRVGHHLHGAHLRGAAHPHWHLDYVRSKMDVREAWVTYDAAKRECQWSGLVGEALGGRVVTPGFGATDCRTCPAHFYHFAVRPAFLKFKMAVARHMPQHAPVQRVVFVGADAAALTVA